MGAGNASTGGGNGGVGPAGLVTKTGKTGTVKDAKKVSGRNEFRTFVKDGGFTGAIIKGITGKTPYEMNLKRRQKFIKDKGLTGDDINMDTSYLGSKEGLAELKSQGYTTASDNFNTGGDNNNNTPTVIKKNIGGNTIQTTAPTEAEVSQSETANADAAALKIKKKGRSRSIMTSAKGVTKTSSDYTLGVKNLLGRV